MDRTGRREPSNRAEWPKMTGTRLTARPPTAIQPAPASRTEARATTDGCPGCRPVMVRGTACDALHTVQRRAVRAVQPENRLHDVDCREHDTLRATGDGSSRATGRSVRRTGPVSGGGSDPLIALAERAVEQVETWLRQADLIETRSERRAVERLSGLVGDVAGLRFAMRFVDRVARPEGRRTAARQLAGLVSDRRLPGFLSRPDRMLLRAGARLAPIVPGVVMPLAARRMRGLVGHLVVDSDPVALAAHLSRRRRGGFRLNVNLLGKPFSGRPRRLVAMPRPCVSSISPTSTTSRSRFPPSLPSSTTGISTRAWPGVGDRLRALFARAATTSPPTFVEPGHGGVPRSPTHHDRVHGIAGRAAPCARCRHRAADLPPGLLRGVAGARGVGERPALPTRRRPSGAAR